MSLKGAMGVGIILFILYSFTGFIFSIVTVCLSIACVTKDYIQIKKKLEPLEEVSHAPKSPH